MGLGRAALDRTREHRPCSRRRPSRRLLGTATAVRRREHRFLRTDGANATRARVRWFRELGARRHLRKASNWFQGIEEGFMLLKRPVDSGLELQDEQWCLTMNLGA